LLKVALYKLLYLLFLLLLPRMHLALGY